MNPVSRALLQEANFRRLWVVGLLNGTIRWLEVLAIGLYTLATTDSPLIVALMLFARTIPSVVFGPVTGTVASRYGRRRLLLGGMLLMAANALALTLLSVFGMLALWHIALSATLSGIVWTLEHTVRRTLLGDVAGIERIQYAMSLDTVSFNSTRFIGPIAGGSLYALLGMTGVYATSLAGFLLAAYLVWTSSIHGRPAQIAQQAFLSTLVSGWRYAKDVPVVRAILLVTLFTNFFGFSYATMVPVIASKVHTLTPAETGVLQAMEGLGAMIVALILAFSSFRFSQVRTFSAGAVVFVAAVLVFALSADLLFSTLSLLMAGAAIASFGAMQSTVLMSRSDPKQRERVMGLLVMSIGAQPAGVLTLGFLAERLGPVWGLATMAGAGLLCVATLILSQPALLTPLSPKSDTQ